MVRSQCVQSGVMLIAGFAATVSIASLCNGQPQAATCAVVVQKSCADAYGGFQGSSWCEITACANEDYCRIGEPLVLWWNSKTEAEWNTKIATLTGTPPGQQGHWWTGFSESCGFQVVCDYPCIFIANRGYMCQQMEGAVTEFSLFRAGIQYEPCPGIEN